MTNPERVTAVLDVASGFEADVLLVSRALLSKVTDTIDVGILVENELVITAGARVLKGAGILVENELDTAMGVSPTVGSVPTAGLEVRNPLSARDSPLVTAESVSNMLLSIGKTSLKGTEPSTIKGPRSPGGADRKAVFCCEDPVFEPGTEFCSDGVSVSFDGNVGI